ncbi:MAG: hypothetical protein ACI8TQ_000410 [Planctomycetota bacterium]|jgi:hypothetical protein
MATAASAQQIIDLEALGYVTFSTADGMAFGGALPGTATEAGKDEAAEDSPRLKLLKKLVFDRRPSAILDAWTKVEDPKPEVPVAPEPELEITVEGEAQADVESSESLGEEDELVDGEEQPADGTEAKASGDAVEEEANQESDAEAAIEAQLMEAELAAKKALETEIEEAKKKLLDWEMEHFKRMVSLGDWSGIQLYLAEIEEFEAKAAYEQLLTSLVAGPVKVQGPLAKYAEKNFFAPEDLRGLVGCAPNELENSEIDKLANLLALCVAEGSLLDGCLVEFRLAFANEEFGITKPQFARILIEANFPVDAGEFLPDPAVAIEENQREVLNLLTRHYRALYAEEQKVEHLEQAWSTTQAALADGEVEDEDKEEALKIAVAIAPDVREELGQAWLEESFTSRPERGMEILRVIGSGTSKGLFDLAMDGPKRLESLQLQTSATEALLAAAPERAAEWHATLNLLAGNWLQEAIHSYTFDKSTSRAPSVTRDPFGNVFYSGFNYNAMNRNIPTALSTDELLLIRPSEQWLALVPAGMRPKFDMVTAQLLLKVNEESDAFPYIENLAKIHPKQAKELVHEFLRVWTRNNNPNDTQQRTNQFMFVFGYDARAGGIPLTRSKQERNLKALAGWVKRLQQLPIDDIDEELIATAFTSAHSKAEVFQLKTIEQVFGDMDELKPKTLSNLVQKMRTNLGDVWRQPAVQKDNKTKRRQKDIQNEILRGYEVAQQVASKALLAHPDSWSLLLARASISHDENNYRQEISKSTEFAGRRQDALADFARAAQLYKAKAPELKLDEESVELFQTWFYASLGACDLKMLDHEKLAAQEQYPLIRAALDSLPGEAAERALASFANSIFTRMSNLNPAVKFRYVKAGLEIVGEHARARDAQEVADYYGDLVTEIKLETTIDGNGEVGHDEAFGMFINIRHTGAIEREAGGFSKYLVNQNNNPYGFNYGRPPEDYRDKFDEAARKSLSEHFEVLSVTFNHPDTNSRASAEYGWRITPYAYVLMKARGPEIDRIPPLRLDLDFSDTTGYAVLPAESAPLAINAAADEGAQRPYRDLRITQSLDERQAKDGKLILEVKASALGLLPDLDSFLDLAPQGFDIVATDDQGISVAKFDEEAEETAVLSERIWMVSMEAKQDLEELPETFEFGAVRDEQAEMEYLRFVDADLATVTSNISLEQSYGETNAAGFWTWTLRLALLLAAGAATMKYLRRRPTKDVDTSPFRMPETVSPFTVIGLLRDIQANNGVSANAREELIGNITHIEGYYFDRQDLESPDLRAIAQRWVSHTN